MTENKEEVKVDGYFYNENGEFLGKEGNSEEVYLATKYKQEKDPATSKIKITNEEVIDLKISHSNFCYIAGVISEEDGFSLDGARTRAQAGFNLVKTVKETTEKKLSLEDQAKWAKTGYSSV